MPADRRLSDAALRELCARMFREPDRLVQAERIPVLGPLDLPPHAHRDLWQLDVAFACKGHWVAGSGKLELRGVTAAAFYPGEAHGYAFRPTGPRSVLYSLKIRVARPWPAVRERILPGHVPGISGEEPLAVALQRLSRLAAAPEGRTAIVAATLAEVLCLWPQRDGAGSLTPGAGVELDGRIEATLEIIDGRLDDPPSLEELAAAAHLSARHFARRFRAICGCSPKAYLVARRLARARELLAQGHLTVTGVSGAVGFASIHTFSRWFRRHAGVSPAQYRENPMLL